MRPPGVEEAGPRSGRGKSSHIDAVGHDLISARKVRLDRASRSIRHGDSRREPPRERPQHPPEWPIPRMPVFAMHVERPDDRNGGAHERQPRRERRERFMDVHDVGAAREHRADAAPGPGIDAQSRLGSAEVHRKRTAQRYFAIGQRPRRGAVDEDDVSQAHERPRLRADLVVDTAVRRQVVWCDNGDPHRDVTILA